MRNYFKVVGIRQVNHPSYDEQSPGGYKPYIILESRDKMNFNNTED
jgi:hypothetical protein